MEYVKFTLFFILAHSLAYMIAGAIALQISKDIYEKKSRHCDFLRDMSNEREKGYVGKYFLPAQILRGFLLAVVLFPLLGEIKELSFIMQFVFFGLLVFIYTHLAAAAPFIDNIEGFVYFQKKYLKKKFFIKFQMEMVLYSILFGTFMGILI
ncbi:MAG: hypothetical protein ACQEQG_10730 [Bacillota bacterium]